ncbi:MAG: FAD-binding protein [Microcella sp.]|uniref:D-arabinono-1,4-lactone oxidase n=1 Tax=Microcella sp. TaxID=1913979 RepID=UPI0024CABA5E|nr:D-arabinono-1,4-lactone oxidase [Microcella sp.]UYN84753.1 MAG: FAD-binding protein [Microcella sp.]
MTQTVTPTGTAKPWRNWARTEQVTPARVERPASADEVADAIARARTGGLAVKPIGSGHSFTGIAVAPGVQLDLTDLAGLTAIDSSTGLVTLAAGTKLHDASALLHEHGLAFENLGDIDVQSISGAVSTGTHGTGRAFGGLATQLRAVTLATADGRLLSISPTENADLWPAARLGLGALGVLVDLTVQTVPTFVLAADEHPEPLDAVLDDWPNRSAQADHVEFYWFPHTKLALTRNNTRLPADAPRTATRRLQRWVDDELLGNDLYGLLCRIGGLAPGTVPGINRLASGVAFNRTVADYSHRVFATQRRVRFRELEYSVPLDAVAPAMRELDRVIEARGWRVTFPVEVRATAADDVWLSTAYGRESSYIAVHRYIRDDHREYLAAAESIMRAHDGRPHWGKLHSRTADDLRPAYPRFDDFVAVRDRLDPERLFANPYLDRVLGR